MPREPETKPIRIRMAPERKAPRNLNFRQFSTWFCRELSKDNFEIPAGSHPAVCDAAFKKYKYLQKKIPSSCSLPQAFDIAAMLKGHNDIDIVVCAACEKLLIGVKFDTDEKYYVYCSKCAEKFLTECRSCHEIYYKPKMVDLGDGTFRCRSCSRLRRKAIKMMSECRSVF